MLHPATACISYTTLHLQPPRHLHRPTSPPRSLLFLVFGFVVWLLFPTCWLAKDVTGLPEGLFLTSRGLRFFWTAPLTLCTAPRKPPASTYRFQSWPVSDVEAQGHTTTCLDFVPSPQRQPRIKVNYKVATPYSTALNPPPAPIHSPDSARPKSLQEEGYLLFPRSMYVGLRTQYLTSKPLVFVFQPGSISHLNPPSLGDNQQDNDTIPAYFTYSRLIRLLIY